jgi:hypothetical protein
MQLNTDNKIFQGQQNTITFSTGLIWPMRTYLQVNTSNDALKYIDTINKKFEEIVSELKKNFPSNSKLQQLNFDPDFDNISDSLEKLISITNGTFYNKLISKTMIEFCSDMIPKMLPQIESFNYYKALKYTENILKNKCISKIKPQGIVTLINNIHMLIEGLPKHSYRNNPVGIYKNNILNINKINFKDIEKYMKSKCTAEDLIIWNNSLSEKIKNSNSLKQTIPHFLTKDESKVLHTYLIGLTPDPDKVPGLMIKFAEELSSKLQKCDDLIELMAWTHQELVAIHPYTDCNGRVARTFMNIIALQAGKEPLLFDNETDYLEAVDTNSNHNFPNYLRDLEKKQIDLNNFTKNCVQNFIELFCEYHKI